VAGLLDGLTVVNLSTTVIGVQIAQPFADLGAEVFWVEPLGGSPLRSQAAWPFWARGAKSVMLDLKASEDSEAARDLIACADVVIATSRPGVMERVGLGYEQLSATNPGLVYSSVTGFGRDNRLSRIKGYEGLVMAKLGAYNQFAELVDRDGPAFAPTPYGGFTAAMCALQGTVAALLEREHSGAGQRVDVSMLHAMNAHDVMFWLMGDLLQAMMAAASAPASAPESAPAAEAPSSPASPVPSAGGGAVMAGFGLMAGLTSDGHWLQFSQSTPKQTAAFVRLIGLEDEWQRIQASGDQQQAVLFADRMHSEVHSRTLAEWNRLFDVDANVFAEVFREGSQLLHHPQLVHDQRVVDLEVAGVGSVRQPGPLVGFRDDPADLGPPPARDQHRGELIGRERKPSTALTHDVPTTPPLDGVVVLELGTFYAAPYGATLLADLGATVIKVEQPDGDPLRWLIPIPELAGVKALLGKKSVAVDMHTDEGRKIVHDLARRADVALQSFRAGVAERLGVDGESLRSVNPNLAYHNGPGFGMGGPYGHRPAYAPTIGAGSGMARRNAGPHISSEPTMSVEEIQSTARKLGVANTAVGQADGFGAVGVGAALALALLVRARQGSGRISETSMLSTLSHVLSEVMVEWDGQPGSPQVDPELFGLGALYRLYETADGWVFLAVTSDREWGALAGALGLDAGLRSDDASLAKALAEIFLGKPASAWEAALTGHDVGCVEVAAGPAYDVLMSDGGLGRELGQVTDVQHPVIGRHSRPTALVRFSRSSTVDDGTAPAVGDHTDEVLRWLDYDEVRIADLRERGIIA
jgi:crotonobetainyl-CoA:carnitine CoA-transferase CaiB-like acyl-CoA transferase